MRIVEWNSQGAFRKKIDHVLSLNPDLLIVPECESETKLSLGVQTPKPNDFLWYGDSPNKGIGIFSYSDYKFELLPAFNPNFRFILPIKVSNKEGAFLLFAIWAMDNKEYPEARYIGQIWLALNFYSSLLSLPTIITGDFNSNKIWDEKERVGNHTDVVNFLSVKNILSTYHEQEGENQGEELHPTFHMYRKKERPYHIDYLFASHQFRRGSSLKLGQYDEWKELSDHVPLIFDTPNPLSDFNIDETFSSLIIKQLKGLNLDTQNRFDDVISKLIEESKSIDEFPVDSETIEERKRITRSIDRLSHIDRMIDKLNKGC
ncbi:MAG: exonuclease [Fluviicola sp. XM-24bin1]|nr:MAG: exonuclease [Fluviicola sp. XM-24bin1]